MFSKVAYIKSIKQKGHASLLLKSGLMISVFNIFLQLQEVNYFILINLLCRILNLQKKCFAFFNN